MIAVFVLSVALAAAPDHEGAMQALAQGRFAEAERALEDETDLLLVARGRAEILFQARDFEGALAAARRGLADAPSDLELLHRASAAGLWLRRQATARGFAERLVEAVEAADLAPDARASWRSEARGFVEEADRLRAAEVERRRTVGRARLTACLVLGAAALLLVLLARQRPGP